MELRDEWTWERARAFLPLDLDAAARESGLLRRLRGTDSAEGLVRLLLMCALPKASLAQAAAWGRETGLSRMGASALFFRLRDAGPLMELLLASALSHAASAPARSFAGRRLLALDGTCLCGPGSKGVDLRVHALYDLGSCAARRLEATGPGEGEGLARHAPFLGPGDLVLADRGYGRAGGLLAALRTGASVLARFEFSHLRLLDARTGGRLSPGEAAGRLPARGTLDLAVLLPGWEAPLRAIGVRGDSGEPLWLLTDLPAGDLAAGEARSLYGLRWQVELFFKRLKSLLDLDEMPTRDGPTARPWALAKLVLAALAALLADGRFPPCGAAGAVGVEAVPQGRVARDARAAGVRRRRRRRSPATPRDQARAAPATHAPGA